MKIERFECDNWGKLKVACNKDGREISNEYWGVPKKIILKLIGAKQAPEMEDVAKWIKEEKEKRNKDFDAPHISDFWSEE